jgi:nicotinamidase-related amidase
MKGESKMSSKKCLLVIDVQQGMFNLSKPLYRGANILVGIKKLIQKARINNVPTIFIQHCGKEKSIFEKGSPGWQIHPEIAPNESKIIIEKNYSDAFHGTNLNNTLKELSVETLVICGLVTEGCIDTTVRRAFSLGYKVIVVSDCHSTIDSEVLSAKQIVDHHNHIFKIFAQVRESDEIVFTPKTIDVVPSIK